MYALPYITWLNNNRSQLGTLSSPQMGGMFADYFHAIQYLCNFTYLLGSPQDGEWGAIMPNGKDWSGMVGQLQHGEIDIGIK